MKVILQKPMDNLGEPLDVVDVAEGYAKNYLIPQGMAIRATRGALHNLEQQRRSTARKEEAARDEARELAARVDGYNLIVPVRAGEDGKLFGSVTAQKITEGLNSELDIDLPAHSVKLDEPIKSLGTYQIELKLYRDVTAAVKVEVLAQQD